MATLGHDSIPFEGAEKLLEIWFAPSPAHVPDASTPVNGKAGLRIIGRGEWEEMLEVVKCKVLNVVEGLEMDAYLLRYVKNPRLPWTSNSCIAC